MLFSRLQHLFLFQLKENPCQETPIHSPQAIFLPIQDDLLNTLKNRIFDQLATRSSLLDAWRIIQKKRKAGGIDGVSVEYYETEFEHNIDKLLKCLKSGAYVPEPYERINIPKDGAPGEYRPLSLPTINDKIVQQSLKQYLEPLFNPMFLDTSYAYRPGKGPAMAISRITHIINSKKSQLGSMR